MLLLLYLLIMDWYVQVQTQDGQLRTVMVYDYNYPSDAKRAALSQTGARQVIYASPFREKQEEIQSKPAAPTEEPYNDFQLIEDDPRPADISGFFGIITDHKLMIMLGIFFLIFCLISPFLAGIIIFYAFVEMLRA